MRYSIRQFLILAVCGVAFVIDAAIASAQISVVGSTLVEHDASPGERFTGFIVVSNDSNEEQNVRVYQTDYQFFADGRSPFDEAGTNPRSNSRWVQPSVRTLRLAPRAQASLLFEVVVPADSMLSGTYWSTIMIEPLPPVARTSPRRSAVGLTAVTRYAVQVASHVGGGGARSVKFVATRLTADTTGAANVVADVENSGTVAYRPLGWIEVFDSKGDRVATAREQRGLLYPGSSMRLRFALPKLAAGEYRAVVYIDTGDEAVFASQLRLQF